MLHKKQRMRSIYDLDSSKIKRVVEVLVKNDTWQIPTIRLVSNKAYKIYKDPEYTTLLEVLPLDKKKEWIQKINFSAWSLIPTLSSSFNAFSLASCFVSL